MSIGSILLGLALAVLVVPLVAGPLIKNRQRQQTAPENSQADSPDTAKQGALAAVRDLDFDFRTGKVAEEDYTPLRRRFMADAAQAVQAADAARGDLDDEIEAAVRLARVSRRKSSECPECHAAVRADDRFCPKCGAAFTAACPQCKTAVQASDKFCPHCGAPLKKEAVAAL